MEKEANLLDSLQQKALQATNMELQIDLFHQMHLLMPKLFLPSWLANGAQNVCTIPPALATPPAYPPAIPRCDLIRLAWIRCVNRVNLAKIDFWKIHPRPPPQSFWTLHPDQFSR